MQPVFRPVSPRLPPVLPERSFTLATFTVCVGGKASASSTTRTVTPSACSVAEVTF